MKFGVFGRGENSVLARTSGLVQVLDAKSDPTVNRKFTSVMSELTQPTHEKNQIEVTIWGDKSVERAPVYRDGKTRSIYSLYNCLYAFGKIVASG